MAKINQWSIKEVLLNHTTQLTEVCLHLNEEENEYFEIQKCKFNDIVKIL